MSFSLRHGAVGFDTGDVAERMAKISETLQYVMHNEQLRKMVVREMRCGSNAAILGLYRQRENTDFSFFTTTTPFEHVRRFSLGSSAFNRLCNHQFS